MSNRNRTMLLTVMLAALASVLLARTLMREILDSQAWIDFFLVSVFIHELGHWMAWLILGEVSWLIVVPFLGGFVLPLNFNEVLEKAKRSHLILMIGMGPIFTCVLMLVGYVMYQTSGYARIGGTLAALNSLLMMTNMLPILGTDGAKLLKLLLGRRDKNIMRAAQITTGLLVGAIAIKWQIPLPLIALLILILLVDSRGKGKLAEKAAQPLNSVAEATGWLIYIMIWIVSVFIWVSVPDMLFMYQFWQ